MRPASNATDKTIEIGVTAPQSSADFKLDNLRFARERSRRRCPARLADALAASRE
jgi:hypothetical protein